MNAAEFYEFEMDMLALDILQAMFCFVPKHFHRYQ